MWWLRRALAAPLDPASLVAFRIGFGLIAAAAAIRFVAHGWVEQLLLAPTFHFAWVSWAVVPPAPVLYGLFAAQALAGLAIAAGWHPRLAIAVWLASFGYVELLDKALYLNHYVLFTLLGLTLLCAPLERVRLTGGATGPAWVLWLLRIEVGLVYLWAGIAKLNADWLLRAEPLTTWLQARADVPLLGPVLAWDPTAVAMSWGGAGYDLVIPWLLWHRRTRPLGLALVAFFHVVVGLLFPIGIFPVLMMLGATLFLEPGWPRRWLAPAPPTAPQAVRPTTPRPLSVPSTLAWCAVVALLALYPARFLWWGTDVSWTERGHRFAWRVLLNEKTGLVDFRIVQRGTDRTWRDLPSGTLTPIQHEQMRTQPDLIRDYALHLQRQHARAGREVAVYADAWASLNGRPSQRLLRPDVDLTLSLAELERLGWIVGLQPTGSSTSRAASDPGGGRTP